jgi:Flp pilus assembly protein TadG
MRKRMLDGNRDRGAALVEFGIVLLLFIGVFLGIVTTGLAFFARLQMTSAVQEAARVVYLDGTAAQALGAATAVYAQGSATISGPVSGASTCKDNPGATVTVRMTRDMPIQFLLGNTTVLMQAEATTQCSG